MTITETNGAPTSRMAVSSMCRDANHKSCAKLRMRCSCECHARKTASSKPALKPKVRPAGEKLGPVIQLVKAEPPARVKKVHYKPLSEQVRPLLEEILVANDHDWFRVVLFFKAGSAYLTVRKLRERFSRAEWEWEARKLDEVGQSAIYVRWIGDKAQL